MEKRVISVIDLPGTDATLHFEIEEMEEFYMLVIEQYTGGKRDFVTEKVLERKDLEGLKDVLTFMLKRWTPTGVAAPVGSI